MLRMNRRRVADFPFELNCCICYSRVHRRIGNWDRCVVAHQVQGEQVTAQSHVVCAGCACSMRLRHLREDARERVNTVCPVCRAPFPIPPALCAGVLNWEGYPGARLNADEMALVTEQHERRAVVPIVNNPNVNNINNNVNNVDNGDVNIVNNVDMPVEEPRQEEAPVNVANPPPEQLAPPVEIEPLREHIREAADGALEEVVIGREEAGERQDAVAAEPRGEVVPQAPPVLPRPDNILEPIEAPPRRTNVLIPTPTGRRANTIEVMVVYHHPVNLLYLLWLRFWSFLERYFCFVFSFQYTGDNFNNLDDTDPIAEPLTYRVGRPFRIDGVYCSVYASIGYTHCSRKPIYPDIYRAVMVKRSGMRVNEDTQLLLDGEVQHLLTPDHDDENIALNTTAYILQRILLKQYKLKLSNPVKAPGFLSKIKF